MFYTIKIKGELSDYATYVDMKTSFIVSAYGTTDCGHVFARRKPHLGRKRYHETHRGSTQRGVLPKSAQKVYSTNTSIIPRYLGQ